MKFHPAICLLLAGSLIALAACSRDPNVRKQKYLESGKRYVGKNQYREAAIQFGNAIQIDPRFAEAHYQLAQTLLKMQQWNPAYLELEKTVSLEPQNYRARIDLANLLITGRDVKQAQEQTDALLKAQPNNAEVHAAVANLLAAQENLPAAMLELQKSIALDPNRWESYLALAFLQMRSNQPDAAEASFKKAVAVSPQTLQAQLALGAFYQSRSRFSEAEQQLRHAMELDPGSTEPRAAIARLLLSEGKKSETESFLKQSKKDFPDNSTGYRMLGDFYFATGDLDAATTEYGSLYHDHPKDVQVKKNYIQLLILKSRLEEARNLDDEILKDSPTDTEALIYRGQIQIRQGHPQNAIETLQTALKNDPDNAVAHHHLGAAYDLLGNLNGVPPSACVPSWSRRSVRSRWLKCARATWTAWSRPLPKSSRSNRDRPTAMPCERFRISIANNTPEPKPTPARQLISARRIRSATFNSET